MVPSRRLDIDDLLDGRLLESREKGVRHRQLLVAQRHPKSVLGNVSDVGFQSDDALHF